MIRVPRLVRWCLLLALGFAGLAPNGVWAQPPAPGEVMIPVGTTGSVPTAVGAMTKKIEVVPPVVQAQLSFDAKSIEITGLAPGFGQVRLLDGMGNVLQVINVQVLPPDLEIPFGETKVFPAITGTTIQDVRVSTPDVVKHSVPDKKDKVEVTGIGLGVTKLTIIDNKGGFQVYNVAVVPSEKYLQFKIRQAVPTATVYPVQIAKGVFMLNGTVERSEDVPAVLAVADSLAAKVINGLRVGGVMQVQLDVVIAQVSRTELRQMSFSWFNNGKVHFLGVSPGQTLGSNVAAASTITVPSVIGNVNGSTNVAFGFVNDKQSFFGFLEALREEGLAKFLACPKLVTMSGKPATFLVGGRLAVPEPSGLGTNAVRFEDFGTQLNFLPLVLGNGKIFIEVEPKVDNINQANGTVIQGTAVPGFDSERLHASVELESGQTFAIGGLIQHQINATTDKIPVLGDLPFLGAAFRAVSHKQVETELLILVTPYLVDPMACNQLPKRVPGQETRIPDDFELFLEGIMEAPRGQRQIFPDGHHYKAAYLNSPSAELFPCGVGGYGNGDGSCGNGGCGNGGCATGGCGNSGMIHNANYMAPQQSPMTQPKMTIPVGQAGHYDDGSQNPFGGRAYPTGTGSYEQGTAMPVNPNAAPASIAPTSAEN